MNPIHPKVFVLEAEETLPDFILHQVLGVRDTGECKVSTRDWTQKTQRCALTDCETKIAINNTSF